MVRIFAWLPEADSIPALTPLTVKSDGPATAAPLASAVTGPWAACLQGEIVEGFNLPVELLEGLDVGEPSLAQQARHWPSRRVSVDELEACAEGAAPRGPLHPRSQRTAREQAVVVGLVHPRRTRVRERGLP